MIKQMFDIDGYWKVVVYYDVDYHFFDDIEFELRLIDFSETAIEETRKTLQSGEAKAVTCSSTHHHTSIIVFNPHTSKADYISSIVHEAEHVKQAMLRAYNVEDNGEAPAYAIGYIVKKMYEIFSQIEY